MNWRNLKRACGASLLGGVMFAGCNTLVARRQHLRPHLGQVSFKFFSIEPMKFGYGLNAPLNIQDVLRSRRRVAHGGIYDHLGGGICRYSTDPQWLVPHFEKMLYDQALVSSIYLDGYLATRKPLYAQTACGVLDYVLGDLQSPHRWYS